MVINKHLQDLPEAESVETLQALRQHRFGWMTPQGRVLACDLHEHIAALARAGAISGDEIEALREAEQRAVRVHDECEATPKDKHANWHNYGYASNAVELQRHKIVANLYADGWVRLGMASLDGRDALCAEGEGKCLARRAKLIRGMAELLDAEYRPEPFSGGSYNYDRHFEERKDHRPAKVYIAETLSTGPRAATSAAPATNATPGKKKPAILRLNLKSIEAKPTAGGHTLYILAGTEIGDRDGFMKKAVAFEEVGKLLVDAIKAGGVDPFRILTQVKLNLTGQWAPRKWKSNTGLDKEAWEFKANSFGNLAVVPLPSARQNKPDGFEI